MPVFWNAVNSEPKRQHRFLVSMAGLKDRTDSAFVSYLARTVKTPAFAVSETEHKFLGNTYYYPGTVTWEEVTMTIVNSLDPDGNAVLYDTLLKSGYLLPSEQGQNGAGPSANEPKSAGTINKGMSTDALGSVIIRELNGKGLVVGTWKLENPWIKAASFGDLDYGGDDMLNVDITIRYDFATYKPGIQSQPTAARGAVALNAGAPGPEGV